MDFHKFPNITLEEAKKAHLADEEIQLKYGVKYLQFWVNEGAGTIFCLVEGPDMRTCESVHQMAHGHIACAMVEVDPSYYSLIMGENIRVDQGLVHDEHGAVDLGYRSILAATVQSFPQKPQAKKSKPASNPTHFEYLKTPVRAREAVQREILKFKGRTLKLSGDDSLVCVFNSASQAVRCAREIQTVLRTWNENVKGDEYPITCTIGLGAGQPVTENNEFIEETIRLAKRLGQVAGNDAILLSSLVQELCEADPGDQANEKIRSLSSQEEAFLTELFGIIESQLPDENFNIDSLVRTIGISRPQLYRKIHGLTGKAPNDLIRDLRLDKALSLLKRKSGNISEIAFEVGFGNPSWFAKCFATKFGCLPSQFIAMSVP
jgi:AraC-like DNA-binding protein